MIDGKKTIKKKTVTYPANTTLLNAIDNASKIYKEMMIDIENNIMIEKTELHPAMLFSEAFTSYVNYKKEEYESNSTKTDCDGVMIDVLDSMIEDTVESIIT